MALAIASWGHDNALLMRLVFTGDISFSGFFADGYKGEGCVSPPVRGFLAAADWVVANVECPLTKRGVESARPLNHSSDPEAGRYLRGLNASIWNLANNHIMDCGPEGLSDTLRCAEENGCKTLGAGRNLAETVRPVIVGDSVKVGLLSCAKPWRHVKAGAETPGALTCDRVDVLKKALSDLRGRVDWIVLVVHAEDEFNNMPMPYTRRRYLEMLSWGADIIVAHHPHVIQNHERIGGKTIFYSLGNFIFDTENQRDFEHTDTGVLLALDFEKGKYSFSGFATRIDREKNRVEPGVLPPVFCDVGSRDYRLLWPLEARRFLPVERKRRLKQSPVLARMSRARLFWHGVKSLRKEKERTLQLGRLLAWTGQWKKSGLQAVAGYVNPAGAPPPQNGPSRTV